METIFITGGTGMIGTNLVQSLLEQTDAKIILLVHNAKPNIQSQYHNRVEVILGDITKSDLGLNTDDFEKIVNNVSSIIHAAASTKFDLEIEVARLINVKGTQNVLDFAKRCINLNKLAFISTVYVSGKKTGIILEQDESSAGFVNSYEQSKYEAEHEVLKFNEHKPSAIYRLSTVVGDSKTGKVDHFTAPHHALRIMHLGLAAMIPGDPNYSVDLISSDYTSQTIVRLFLSFKPEIFNIVSGNHKSYLLKELLDESFKCIAEIDPGWGKRRYPKPLIVSEKTFDLFLTSAEQADNPLIRNVLKAMRHFAHQLNYPKTFDMTNLLKTIPEYEEESPDIRSYYSKVVQYCLVTKWGKNV